MEFWINCQVHYQFQVFINQLETFYLLCGKGKQNNIYAEIANLCHAAYNLLFQTNMPDDDPGPRMATISGGIQTQLDMLTETKVGNENSNLFTTHHGNTKAILKTFTQIFKQYLSDYAANPELAKNSFKEMKALLFPLDILKNKINTLNIYRREKNDALTLFKRAGRYSSNLMVSAAFMMSASIFTGLLSIVDHTVGPAMDKWLDEKIEKNIDYKDLFAITFFLISLILLMRALAKNYRSNPISASIGLDGVAGLDTNNKNLSLKNVTEIAADDIKVIELEEDDDIKNNNERALLLN